MANFNGIGRSNYFKVKDQKKFEDDCRAIGFKIIIDDNDDLFAIVMDDNGGSLPYDYELETFEEMIDGVEHWNTEEVEFDLVKFVQTHVHPDYVFIWTNAGYEWEKYVAGISIWVNTDGDTGTINIHDIYEIAKTANPNKVTTIAEY